MVCSSCFRVRGGSGPAREAQSGARRQSKYCSRRGYDVRVHEPGRGRDRASSGRDPDSNYRAACRGSEESACRAAWEHTRGVVGCVCAVSEREGAQEAAERVIAGWRLWAACGGGGFAPIEKGVRQRHVDSRHENSLLRSRPPTSWERGSRQLNVRCCWGDKLWRPAFGLDRECGRRATQEWGGSEVAVRADAWST